MNAIDVATSPTESEMIREDDPRADQIVFCEYCGSHSIPDETLVCWSCGSKDLF